MKLCKACGKWKPIDAFYRVKSHGREYWMRACSTCTDIASVERRRNHRAHARARQALARAQEKRQREAATTALVASRPLAKVPWDLLTQIEQVIARVDTGDSLDFAARRVGISVDVVRAWLEAA